MKADKNFRLSKAVKRILGSIQDKDQRRVFKAMMIQAQVDYEGIQRRKSKGQSDGE